MNWPERRARLTLLRILYRNARKHNDFAVGIKACDLAVRMRCTERRVHFILDYLEPLEYTSAAVGDTIFITPKGALFYENETDWLKEHAEKIIYGIFGAATTAIGTLITK